MKTITFKKIAFVLCMIVFTAQTAFALNHGSIKGQNMRVRAVTNGTYAPTGLLWDSIDYKAVTIPHASGIYSTWAWVKLLAPTRIFGTEAHSLRIRYYSTRPLTAKEFWAQGKSKNSKEKFGGSTVDRYGATLVPTTDLAFWVISNGMWCETESSIYFDYDEKNSQVSGDTQAPVLGACVADSTGVTGVRLALNGTDNSGDFFYYIHDAANNIEAISFVNSYLISGLTAAKTYNFTVTPIDFNGNEGTPVVITSSTQGSSIPSANYTPTEGIGYYLKHVGSELNLDINKDKDPSNLLINTPTDPSQVWQFIPVTSITSAKVYNIKNVETGKYIQRVDGYSSKLINAPTNDATSQFVLGIYNSDRPDVITINCYTTAGHFGTDAKTALTTVWTDKNPSLAYNSNYAWLLIQANLSGVESLKNTKLRAYPNPTTTIMNIESNTLIKEVRVVDILGQIVKEISVSGLTKTQISVENLQQGSYILKIVDADNKQSTLRFIKN